jgi:hypothetical protein
MKKIKGFFQVLTTLVLFTVFCFSPALVFLGVRHFFSPGSAMENLLFFYIFQGSFFWLGVAQIVLFLVWVYIMHKTFKPVKKKTSVVESVQSKRRPS